MWGANCDCVEMYAENVVDVSPGKVPETVAGPCLMPCTADYSMGDVTPRCAPRVEPSNGSRVCY